jgi:ubiquinone/menaquinone biosynthesis C-methylase UbiE
MEYPLGHGDPELDRLIKQSQFFGVLTEQVLRLAGVSAGMTVLDVGCGAGDVSLLAASLVGPGGRVIGVDRSADAVALARRRSAASGVENVEFRVADLAAFALDHGADAVIGRLVLMYFADPVMQLRRLVELVRPGGLIVFQEMHVLGGGSEPHCALWDLSIQRVDEAFRRAGADPTIARKLARVFIDAGLPRPEMLLGARVDHDAPAASYGALAEITRTLLPVMERTGIATAREIEIDTLAARLRDEALAHRATLFAPPLIGAWARRA